MALGAIESLHHAGHEVSVYGKKNILPLFTHHPSVYESYCLQSVTPKFDAAVLCTNSFSSAWDLFWKKIPRRIGFRNEMRSGLLTQALPWEKNDKSTHLVERYHELVAPLGVKAISAPKLVVSDKEKELVKLLYQKHGIDPAKKTVGFHTQAAYGPAKMWPEENFQELAQKLSDQGIQCLFFGTELDRVAVGRICPDGGWNFCGDTTLRLLMGMIERLDLFITNDSGPMHIGDALNVPTLSLFGSTAPSYTAPFSNKHRVLYTEQACSPCFKRVCPIDMRCMHTLKVSYVKEKALSTLYTCASV